jgi:uncharacterized protein (DUF2336 family)
VTAKPTVAGLGVDLAAQVWQRSGHGDGAIEIAVVRTGDASHRAPARQAPDSPDAAQWVLMRVAGDPDQRILVFDRHEWECFLDGARNGEFDDAAVHDHDPAG